MKINVGTKYEGKSNDFALPDGLYVLQIISIETTAGRVNMVLATAKKRFVYKTFYMKDKNGKPSEKGLRELSDFITTAMQVEEPDVEVEITDALGLYIECELKNSSFVNASGVKKSVVYLNKPKRANGFDDDMPSVFDELSAKLKLNKAKKNAEKRAEEEGVVEEEVVEEGEDNGGADDLLASLGL